MIKSNDYWDKEEIMILEESAGERTIQSIARKLNRTPQAVRSKLNRLGFTSVRELNGSMSLMQLAKALGVSRSVVVRWINEYGLPATKKNYYFYHGKVRHYTIFPDEFWKWAEGHKEKINFARIDKYALLPEPEWVAHERKKDRKLPKKDKRHWTKEEDEILLSMYESGATYKEIAETLGRSIRSVPARMSRLRNKVR